MLTTFVLDDTLADEEHLVGVADNAIGTGYLMYSEVRVHDRLTPLPAEWNTWNVVATQFAGGQWYYNDNTTWHPFTPTFNDRLLAEVNFDTDEVASLACHAGQYEGIDVGFSGGDIEFLAGQTRTFETPGEFVIYGSEFETGSNSCGAIQSIDPDTAQSDFITSDPAFVLRGALTPGMQADLHVGGRVLDAASMPPLVIDAESWSVDLSASEHQLPVGQHVAELFVDAALVDQQVIDVRPAMPSVSVDSIWQDELPIEGFNTTVNQLIVKGNHNPASELILQVLGNEYRLGQSHWLTTDGQGVWTLDLRGQLLPLGETILSATSLLPGGEGIPDLSETVTQSLRIVGASIDRIDSDAGVPDDLLTSDPNLVIHGSHSNGTEIEVVYDGTRYSAASPELTVSDANWTLDLAAQTQSIGDHEVSVEYTDPTGISGATSRSVRTDHTCQIPESFELVDESGQPASQLGTIAVDSLGRASLDLDVSSRKVLTDNHYFVDQMAEPGGDGLTWSTAFRDIREAFDRIGATSVTRAEIHVGPGVYHWGDVGDVGFRLNIVGAGIGQTIVQHKEGDRYAAQIRGRDTYVEGISFVGGEIAMDVRNVPLLTVVASEFKDSTQQDGLNVLNASSVLVIDSISSHNHTDGFSYANPSGNAMEVVEANVTANGNGLNLLFNSQGSSAHGTVRMIRLGGQYTRNQSNIVDVTSGPIWNVDVTTADAVSNDNELGGYVSLANGLSDHYWIIGGSLFGDGAQADTVWAYEPFTTRYSSVFSEIDQNTGLAIGSFVADNSALAPVFPSCPFQVSLDFVTPDTGTIDDWVTSANQLRLSGTALGGEFEIEVAGEVFDELSPEVSYDGTSWELDLTGMSLSEGVHEVTITGPHPGEIETHDSRQLTIDQTPPLPPTLLGVHDLNDQWYAAVDATIVLPQTQATRLSGHWQEISVDRAVRFDGWLFVDGVDSELVTSPDGAWQLDLSTLAVGPGEHLIEVISSDLAGNAIMETGSMVVALASPETVGQAVALGDVGRGVNVVDSATGIGYLMHSRTNLYQRFPDLPPSDGNSAQVIAVRFDAGTWSYGDGELWHPFTAAPTDRLIAEIDLDQNTFAPLQGTIHSINGIAAGYYYSDLQLHANQWNGKTNKGEVQIEGSYFVIEPDENDALLGDVIGVGDLGKGVAVDDRATGTGYLLHSQQVLSERLAPLETFPGSAAQIAAVRHITDRWQINIGNDWYDLEPAIDDRLIAAVDFDSDTITSLQGLGGTVFGINQGYHDGDLSFIPDRWNGKYNRHEITVVGSAYDIRFAPPPEAEFVPPTSPLDVNSDGQISPIDALQIINELSRRSRDESCDDCSQMDTNGDKIVSPLDALLVINWLSRNEQQQAQRNSRSLEDRDFAISELSTELPTLF
ncbi:MAG: dockerin type I domain-containing protein [Planctomycetota bacterium]